MAAGLPEFVDCARLAEDAAVLERVYALGELPRLQDLLAEPGGTLHASFAFGKAASGRAAARVAIRAVPQLLCQRCMQGFAFPVSGSSEVEFTSDEEAAASDTERELFLIDAGMVSLRELAEEELLLAVPIVAVCSAPQSCGHAPSFAVDAEESEKSGELRRPFSALQDLLKKT
ncbi:MAG: YceD family protein [Steroidobacteraceae bacterium]